MNHKFDLTDPDRRKEFLLSTLREAAEIDPNAGNLKRRDIYYHAALALAYYYMAEENMPWELAEETAWKQGGEFSLNAAALRYADSQTDRT